MTDWTGQDYLNDLASRPAARLPASVGEVWNAEWERAGLDTISGVGKPYHDAVGDLESAIAGAAGQDLTDYAFSHGINLAGAASPDRRAALLGQLADTLPEDARKTIEPLKDVRKRAAEKAQKIEADANDTAAATYGLSGVATAFVAGIARQTVDPANLAAMVATAPIGGPLEGGVLKVLARQAAAGAAAQAVVEPFIEPARGELGLEHGADRALHNIAGAAVGGAVVGGGILGLSALLRAGAGRFRTARPEAPAFDTSGKMPFTGYFTEEDASAFYQGAPTGSVPALSLGEAGNVPNAGGGNFDIAAGAAARPTRGRAPEAGAPPPSDFAPGYLRPEDAAALDRGAALPPAASFGEVGGPMLTGKNFDIGRGADAGPTRVRLPDEPPRPPGDLATGYLQADDAGAFDRGGRPPAAASFGEVDDGSSWHPVGQFSSADFDAAARLAERDHLIDAAAPTPDAAGKIRHSAMVDEAAEAIEAARPADPRAVSERLRGDGVDVPEAEIVTTHIVARPATTARYRPHSLLEFIAANGGISAKDPLAADVLQSFGGENPFIPGFGRLIRKEGKAVDAVREASTEAKYLFDPAAETGGVSTIDTNSLLAAIDEEARGNRQYPAGAEGTKTKAEISAETESSRAAREQARVETAANFDARMQELQITEVPVGLRKRALQLIEKEGHADPLLAYERALIEHEDKIDAIRRARHAEQEQHIPGWDVPDDAGATSAPGGDAARAIPERPGNAGAGESPRTDRGGAGSAGEGGAGELAGDPALRQETARALEAHGGDVEIMLPDENGNLRKVSARLALRDIEDDARAAAEYKNCVGSVAGTDVPF